VGDGGTVGRTRALKFIVGSRLLGTYSYSWSILAGGTSFYVKPLLPAMQTMKVSLHGPDPARGLRGGYELEPDRGADAAVEAAGGAFFEWVDLPDQLWFPGHEVAPCVDLVLRFRFGYDLFTSDAVTAEPPRRAPRPSDVAGLIPPPSAGRAVDVNVYVCHRVPFWPHEQRARRDNACLGPLVNKAGQHLTAVIFDESVEREPSPVPARAPVGPTGTPALTDRVRGVSAALDRRGFLWVHELWFSRAQLEERRSRLPACD
jgi:hypothetical protein